MPTGTQLLLDGKYDSAIRRLAKESQQEPLHDFRIGPICDLGVAYLLTGQFSKAIEHFRELQETAIESVSLHQIYEGLAWWYSGQTADAVKVWKNAKKCGYSVGGSGGLDVALILWFAHARQPQLIDWEFVRSLLVTRTKRISQRISQTSVWNAIARYALGEIDDAAVLQTIEKRVVEISALELPDNLCRLHFYTGVQAAKDGDLPTFGAEMNSAATAKLERIIFEQVVARLECRFERGKGGGAEKGAGAEKGTRLIE